MIKYLLLRERLLDLAEVSIQVSLFFELSDLILGARFELLRHLLRAVKHRRIFDLLNVDPHLHYKVLVLGCEWHQI